MTTYKLMEMGIMSKIKSYIIAFIILPTFTSLLYNCSANNAPYYTQGGYYISTVNYSFDLVHNAVVSAVENDQTYTGATYKLDVDKSDGKYAIVRGINPNGDNNDYVEVEVSKKSANQTQLNIKYNNNGDALRSSALLEIIKDNLKQEDKNLK
ncbi:DUF3568 family protein [Francisella philomiragia]|uniref:DUF3568 domain-containing protein n=1 Tax=Francisella philomiragia TaxID=28110 RepID=A0A0B6D472_9GAMM|nr:DUF3568 family protein [Francisella philomiragia]AJI52433.1 hypothetical protein LA55_1451 [Francisella philomiragia]MBY7733925.1 DUF3568 domain-containing protein [Francisella philomiragia]